MKKIISFCIYGNNPKYTDAAIANLKLQPIIYPGWTCRFYVDGSVPTPIILELEKLGAEVVVMPNAIGHLGMFWRFEPLKDTSLERFIVRDTDSRLNVREAAAVREWEQLGTNFHIMRDNKAHNVPICGGMWGATSSFINEIKNEYDMLKEDFIFNHEYMRYSNQRGEYFNFDQPFLWHVIWPKIIRTHTAHIANIDNLRLYGNERLFPITNLDNSFVGQPYDI